MNAARAARVSGALQMLRHAPGFFWLRAQARVLGGRYVVERRRPPEQKPWSPLDMAARLGVKWVFDVGASQGEWTIDNQPFFPGASFVLAEPLEEWRPALERLGHDFVIAAVSDTSGEITFNVHGDLYGSSLLHEQEEGVDGVPRTVATVTLDDLAAERPGPYAVKVDVQGAEMRVLKGAHRVLRETELLIIETSFFRTMKGGPVFHELVAYLVDRGFVVYGFLDFIYRPYDGALSQADVVFVRADGPLWAEHVFATPEQRAAQNAQYVERLEKELR
jgi:FkbM family methyltransferase